MSHNRLLTFSETYNSPDAICKYFNKYLGLDSPEYKLLKNNIVQIINPKTGELFESYFCLLHKEETFFSLKQKDCILLVNEDVESGKVIIYVIDYEDYRADVYEEAFKKALLLIDKKD